MTKPNLLVTMETDERLRPVIARSIGDVAHVAYLQDMAGPSRTAALQAATVILARNTAKELSADETALLGNARLLQFVTAGVDYIPLAGIPAATPIACNGGGYAEPMAEHAVAMAFAAAKRIILEHEKLSRGEFDQFRSNRMLAGNVCGILGFGGIGVATARLMRGLGLKVHAINRRGATTEAVDWIGRSEQIDMLLAASDVLVLSLPLTKATHG